MSTKKGGGDNAIAVIEAKGQVNSKESTSVATEGFLELLVIYFTSAIIMFKGSYYVQKDSLNIGSCIALVLTGEMFVMQPIIW